VAGAPAAIAVAAGNSNFAYVDSLVATPPSVRVTDADGNSVSAVPVTFSVTGGGGIVTGATPFTAADGTASVGSWRLGGNGAEQLTATSTSVPAQSAVFTATAFDPPTVCGQTAFLTIGRLRDGNLKASSCTVTSATRLGGPSFTGSQGGGTYFYDLYQVDVPAQTIVSIEVIRGSIGVEETLLAYDNTGAYLDRAFLDPLIINNSTAGTVRYQVLFTTFTAGKTGTYSIRANKLIGP
jgi:hypothetical protein